MPQWLREAEAELTATPTLVPTLALTAPCANLSTIAGAAVTCVSELQVAMVQLTSRLGQPATVTAAAACHSPAESAAAVPSPPAPAAAALKPAAATGAFSDAMGRRTTHRYAYKSTVNLPIGASNNSLQ